jgi:hypothetical protein
MAATNDVIYRVGCTGVEQTNAKLATLFGSFKDIAEELGLVTTATAVAVGAFSLLNKSIEEARQSSIAERGVESRLASTGNAAEVSAKQLKEWAAEIQRTTDYTDDAVLTMDQLLLTFTKIKGQTFKDAQQAVIDMATVMAGGGEGDLKSAAIQVGKALQDPEKGITALRKVGVNFNKEQQEVINTLVKTGQSAKAQAMILKELKVEFGNSAVAMSSSSKQLQNAFNDLLETQGKRMLPFLDGVNFAFKNHLIMMNADLAASLNQEQDYLRQRFVFWNQAATGIIVVTQTMGALLMTSAAQAVGNMLEVFKLVPVGIFESLKAGAQIINNFDLIINSIATGSSLSVDDLIPGAFKRTGQTLKDIVGLNKNVAADYVNIFKNVEKQFSTITWESLSDLNRKMQDSNNVGPIDIPDLGGGDAGKAAEQLNALLSLLADFQDKRYAMSLSGMDQELALIDLEYNQKKAIIDAGITDATAKEQALFNLKEMYGAKSVSVTSKYAEQENQEKQKLCEADVAAAEQNFQAMLEIQNRFDADMRSIDADYYKVFRLQQLQDEYENYRKAGVDEVFLHKWVTDQKKEIDREYRRTQEQMRDQVIMDWQENHKYLTGVFNSIGSTFASAMSQMVRITTKSKNDLERLFVDMANAIIAELMRILLKEIAVWLMLKMIGGGNPAMSMLGGSGGDFFPSGNIASVGTSPGYTPTHLPTADTSNEFSVTRRLDRLISAIENNPPQIYTQEISGVPFDNAVKKAAQAKNAL